ncbi:shikimate kinase [Mangrovibacterium diazotrophicum]|uniref:Shikimate kinase n=1 Tax=Mangrovibacterium diazotrophicum TaxID=1261403 RepID=A0A419VVJ1_9BACT|nr:shikimate kinase [Mangrovibacterium diazotrophicum]RKD86153.1 shikimate kinase [Mangrovibacterium diazotrophicum]
MRIYLIGYMACGKTTLGKELAKKLSLSFLDLDKYLEKKYFKTIPQIFEEEGESGFRLKEQACLQEVSEFEDVVIATGGGAPCFFDNVEVMNRTGICIFLDVDAEELANRLMQSKTERPLVKGKSPEELVGFIEGMLEKRRPYYEQASYQITGSNITTPEILSRIEFEHE